MITVAEVDILQDPSPYEAIVCPINTVGVMGAGLAKEFANRYPKMFDAYKDACKNGRLKAGHVWVYDHLPMGQWDTGERPNVIICFPTKRHYNDKSKLEDVVTGLIDLIRVVQEKNIRSLAIPALGCGLGGLSWPTVRPVIEAVLAALSSRQITLIPPQGNFGQSQAKRTKR